MKLTKKATLLSLILITSIAYAQEAEVIKDEYTEDISEVSTEISDEYEEADLETAVKSKKASNSFLDFFKSTNSNMIFSDQAEITTPNVAGKFKKQTGNFVYLLNSNTVGFCSPTHASYTFVLFDERTQKEFVIAAKRYFSDFENKKLDRKDKKSEKKYNPNVNIKMYWGPSKNQAKNEGTTGGKFGYKFKDKSPYFCITLPVTLNDKYDPNSDVLPRESVYTQFFFTKAQLKALMDYVENFDYTETLIEEEVKVKPTPVVPDEY